MESPLDLHVVGGPGIVRFDEAAHEPASVVDVVVLGIPHVQGTGLTTLPWDR
jgi:hypothetical protein